MVVPRRRGGGIPWVSGTEVLMDGPGTNGPQGLFVSGTEGPQGLVVLVPRTQGLLVSGTEGPQAVGLRYWGSSRTVGLRYWGSSETVCLRYWGSSGTGGVGPRYLWASWIASSLELSQTSSLTEVQMVLIVLEDCWTLVLLDGSYELTGSWWPPPPPCWSVGTAGNRYG